MSDHLFKLATDVLQRAAATGATVTTAESCTGGLLAATLTDVEGLSHVFDRGFVVYSEAAKCELLDVERGMVARCGAVSRDVAFAMARGALARSQAELAIAITRFAGPGDDADEEGLVHFAAVHANGDTLHREEHFGGFGREPVRRASVEVALGMMKELLDG